MSDEELIFKIQKGDHQAFEHVFKNLFDVLLSYINTFTNNKQEAKDIVQNSFIILWKKRKQLKSDFAIQPFLFKVAYNLYITEYRKGVVEDKVFDEIKYKSLSNLTIEDNSITKKRVEKLNKIISQLPPKCREILIMNKREGLKYKEISESLNVSVKTVESQMRIAYKKIREAFEKDTLILISVLRKDFFKSIPYLN